MPKPAPRWPTGPAAWRPSRRSRNEIVRELDLTRLLETIVARAAQLVGAASGTVSLWDPEREELAVKALYHMDPVDLDLSALKLGQAAGGLAALRREAVIVNDYRLLARPQTKSRCGAFQPPPSWPSRSSFRTS